MNPISSRSIEEILLGTEHGGVHNGGMVDLPVQNPGVQGRAGNNSGLTFGVVSFDVASGNRDAARAYEAALDAAAASNAITQADADRLRQDTSIRRPDLDPRTAATYRSDIRLINNKIFGKNAQLGFVSKSQVSYERTRQIILTRLLRQR